MDKKLLSVAVVAILVIAGVGALLLWYNTQGADAGSTLGTHLSESELPGASSRLWVYGNANEDDRINDDDIAYLEDIVEGKKGATRLADANCDGEIDRNDVAYLKKIINGDDMKVYYINNYNNVAMVNWPVSSIATGYCSGAQAVEVAGATDKLKIADNFITKNYVSFNPAYASLPSYGENEEPDYEALIGAKIDVYLIGYFVGGVDEVLESKLNPAGIDVMFLTCADNSGVDQPNEHMDRTLLMIAYLIQGDLGRAYEYLAWHDGIISKATAAAATLSEDDKKSYLMARTTPADKTTDISITGKNNINNIHAETAGAYSIGQHNAGLPQMYQTIAVETIIGLHAEYYVDNGHAGFRWGGGTDAVNRLAGYLQNDQNRYSGTTYEPHLLGMAREAGNSPLYVIEIVFYQDVMYPQLDNGLDGYEALFHYFLEHFTSVENPHDVPVEAFFQAG